MTKLEFNCLFVDKKHGVLSFELMKNLRVFRQPLEIVNEETDETIKFKTIDELLNYKINDKTVWEIIESKDKNDLFPEYVIIH